MAISDLGLTWPRTLSDSEGTFDTVGELKSEPPAFGNDVASRISAPTLLINGAKSPKVLHTIASRLAKAIPNSEAAKVSGSAHFPHIAKPQEFNTLVLDFLTKTSPESQLKDRRELPRRHGNPQFLTPVTTLFRNRSEYRTEILFR